jgi:chemotaxis response regulator CheB
MRNAVSVKLTACHKAAFEIVAIATSVGGLKALSEVLGSFFQRLLSSCNTWTPAIAR